MAPTEADLGAVVLVDGHIAVPLNYRVDTERQVVFMNPVTQSSLTPAARPGMLKQGTCGRHRGRGLGQRAQRGYPRPQGTAGTRYEILIEAYAGHGPTPVTGGPVPDGEHKIPQAPAQQVTTTETTFGIWHEEIYQLWLDCMTLLGVRDRLPEMSLRVQEIESGLKVMFPVSVHTTDALHEIQFGHLARPTHESTDADAAQFEVCQQKWSALCDNAHGVALLNDCKYGISVQDNVMGLTLLKSGLAPDEHADLGMQKFTYAFYAWEGPFSESDVVQKGYELNTPVPVRLGGGDSRSLFSVDQPNVIIETVKLAEDGSGDMIVRLYESMRKHTRCVLLTALPVSRVFEADMLEHEGTQLKTDSGRIGLELRPFEIKTVRLKTGKDA